MRDIAMCYAFKASVRAIVAAAMTVVLSMNVVAAPRENVDRDRGRSNNPVIKVVKRIIQALGDGLTVPLP
jgi:hypothetical protein